MQIIGNVKPVAGGVWDSGWIYDPEKDLNTQIQRRADADGSQSLKVVGYMGTKLLSETMTWKRAPADLKRCGA